MPDISRVTRTHLQARNSYDRLSRWYNFIEGGWETPPRRLGLELLQALPGEKLLEIGCGTGNSMLDLTEKVCSIGIDISFKMLALTHDRITKAGKSNPLVQGDALYLPFTSGYFDAVFMAFTLELIDTPEISPVLDEIRRVLRFGGRLGVVSLSKLGGSTSMKTLYEWFHARFPIAIDCRPIYVRASLEEAGFSVVEHKTQSLTGLGIELAVGKIVQVG